MKKTKALFIVAALFAVCAAYLLGRRSVQCGAGGGQPGAAEEPASEEDNDISDNEIQQKNYIYSVCEEDNTVIILSYLGNDSIVFVPEELEGRTVSAIGEEAFSGIPGIEQVILPDGIVEIGEEAFSYCPKLQYVFMAQGVKTIGYGAFMCCPSLMEVRFPEGLEEVGNFVCGNCPQLEKVTIPKGLKDIGYITFDGCPSLRLIYGNSQFAEIYAQKEGYVYVDLDRIESEGNVVW